MTHIRKAVRVEKVRHLDVDYLNLRGVRGGEQYVELTPRAAREFINPDDHADVWRAVSEARYALQQWKLALATKSVTFATKAAEAEAQFITARALKEIEGCKP